MINSLDDLLEDHRKSEQAYRRGVSQTLSRIADLVHAGYDYDDLCFLTDESMKMRYETKSYMTYLDELIKRLKDNNRHPSQGRLSKDTKDLLSRSDFEWQEFVLESPTHAAEIIIELFEYVKDKENL